MKVIPLLIVSLLFNVAYAHQPDLSTMMVYEQNGKSILVLKGSLTAFEGEVDFHFKKGAYKTPEEFIQLVTKHFEKNCLVTINNEVIKLENLKVILGHETTLFVELVNKPENLKTLLIRNTFFKDMPNNQCELILTENGLPQYQYIFNDKNDHEVKLTIEKNKWVLEEPDTSILKSSSFLCGGLIFLISLMIIGTLFKKRTNQVFKGRIR